MAEVLLRCSSESVKQAPDLPPCPVSSEEKGEMVVSTYNNIIEDHTELPYICIVFIEIFVLINCNTTWMV